MRFIPLIVLLIFTGCSWLIPTPKKIPSAKNTDYKLNYSSSEWKLLKQTHSDYVYQNQNGSTLIINSFCGQFQDEPLQALAEKTFNGLYDVKNRTESSLTLSNREAFRLEADGSLDGVTINIKVINMRRNNCYYDFLRITPQGVTATKNQPEEMINAMEFLP